MRKAIRDVELAVGLVVEADALPEAEARRAGADVHDHVEDRAARAAHELCLSRLEVHAAQHPSSRARVVVLHEAPVDPQVGQPAGPEGLEEEAARVAVHGGLEQDGPVEACRQALHSGARLSTRSATIPASASDEVAAGEGALRTCSARSVSDDDEVVHEACRRGREPALARPRSRRRSRPGRSRARSRRPRRRRSACWRRA